MLQQPVSAVGAAGEQQVKGAGQQRNQRHGADADSQYQYQCQNPVRFGFFAAACVMFRVPFVIRCQADDQGFQKSAQDGQNEQHAGKHRVQIAQQGDGQQRQRQGQPVQPAEQVFASIQIKAMNAEAAEDRGEKCGERLVLVWSGHADNLFEG